MRSDHTSGTTTNLRAAEFVAVASGTGTNTNVFGLNSYALKDAGSNGTTANMYGVRGEVEVDAGTCTNAYAFQSHIDRDGGTITTGFLYYGSYSGTVGTKWGVYVTGETKNYFSGNVGIGVTSPGYKLDVDGDINVSSGSNFRINGTAFANSATIEATTADTANKIALRDASGDILARLFRSDYQNQSDCGAAIAFRNSTSDNYIRFCSDMGAVRTRIGAYGSGSNITRTSHSNGYFIGSYNSVEANSTKTNPIYVIGSNYMPSDTSLNNMHGIGYSHGNFTSILTGGWGLYVAADGDARIGLNASSGNIKCTGYVDAGGHMKNNNPCFHARSNVARGVGVYIFNVQELDSHNAYNHTNGRFTAPIAGRYVFTVWAISHPHNYMLLEIRKNGSRVYNASPYTSTQLSTVTGTIVINLAVNDYVDVRIGVGTAYGGGNDHNGFCGYMIG